MRDHYTVNRILMPYSLKKTYKKQKLGQHFLINNKVIEKIIDYASIKSNETILEIGGGTGSLTAKLCERAQKVIVIELDKKLADILSTLQGVEVIIGDALRVDFPTFDKTVSNLPYSMSSNITFKLLKYDFICAILMYQLEFAKRMVAVEGTKEYSRLTVCLNYKAKVSILDRVPRSAFFPQPQVESAIVKLVPIQSPFRVSDENFFKKFVTGIFTQRRKKLKGAILNASSLIGITDVNDIINKIPKDFLNLRPYELKPDEIAAISNQILELIKQ
jgi:16S rRNA (adenine1518-N6/adenine1519-N6)-dimethyltransferase